MSSKVRLMRSFVERAMRGMDSLTMAERADLHEAAALALRAVDRRAADVAQHTAGLLRQTEHQQLEFAALLRS